MSGKKVLYAFSFPRNNSISYVFEIKYEGLPDDTPKHLKYQWFLYLDSELIKLEFKSMSDGFREFQDLSKLDMNSKVYERNGDKWQIEECADDDKQKIVELL
jgi:hypothetical protein